MAANIPPPDRPVKVLMLHGYTQSGPLFQAKTGALRKTLQKAFPKGIELVYPTGPTRITAADESFLGKGQDGAEGAQDEAIDAWGWWRRKGSVASSEHPLVYEGIEQGLSFLADLLKEQGPFDGVIGFSQGAACAAMLASILEPGRKQAFEALYDQGEMRFPEAIHNAAHPPLKFAVSYSGFTADRQGPYHAFYEPKIATPMLHFLGTQDVLVDEARSLALFKACMHAEEKYIVYHPGGHFLPSTQKECVNALIGFIKEVLHGEAGQKEEESVEDMDVPF